MTKAKIKLKGKEYRIRFTAGFWKKVKKLHGLTPSNLENRLQDDFADIVVDIVLYGIYYGLGDEQPESIDKLDISKDYLENNLEQNVTEIIIEAVIDGMPKFQQDFARALQKKQQQKLKDIWENKSFGKEEIPIDIESTEKKT